LVALSVTPARHSVSFPPDQFFPLQGPVLLGFLPQKSRQIIQGSIAPKPRSDRDNAEYFVFPAGFLSSRCPVFSALALA
jgi:hypothetical protein